MEQQRQTPVRTNVIWEALAWTGYEHLCLEASDEGYTVDGLIIALLQNQPSRTWYRIELAWDWTFQSLHLSHTLEIAEAGNGPVEHYDLSRVLRRSTDGQWVNDGFNGKPDLGDCTDIDIAVTPFTNTLPIRRLDLQVGEAAEIDVAYVTVPELTVSPAPQRYTRLADRAYRFESLDSGFTADITVDGQGIVTDYPGLFQRVWPESDSAAGSA